MSVQFYRSAPRLLACVPRAPSMHFTADAPTPGQNINRLALTIEDQQRWGLAGGNHGQVGLFHFNFRRAS